MFLVKNKILTIYSTFYRCNFLYITFILLTVTTKCILSCYIFRIIWFCSCSCYFLYRHSFWYSCSYYIWCGGSFYIWFGCKCNRCFWYYWGWKIFFYFFFLFFFFYINISLFFFFNKDFFSPSDSSNVNWLTPTNNAIANGSKTNIINNATILTTLFIGKPVKSATNL